MDADDIAFSVRVLNMARDDDEWRARVRRGDRRIYRA